MRCASPTSSLCSDDHDRSQNRLRIMRWCGAATLLIGALTLIAGWITVYLNRPWLGITAEFFFLNTIIFFLLSIMAKMQFRMEQESTMVAEWECSDEGCCDKEDGGNGECENCACEDEGEEGCEDKKNKEGCCGGCGNC